jgi:penicillin amidase
MSWPEIRPGSTTSRRRLREERDGLLHRAGQEAIRELGPLYGGDPEGWRWGRMHRLTLVSPIRREGFAAALLGGGSHAMGGSQETLSRAAYDYNRPYDVSLSASLRMVMDRGFPTRSWPFCPAAFRPRSRPPARTGGTLHERGGSLMWFSDRKTGKRPDGPALLRGNRVGFETEGGSR